MLDLSFFGQVATTALHPLFLVGVFLLVIASPAARSSGPTRRVR